MSLARAKQRVFGTGMTCNYLFTSRPDTCPKGFVYRLNHFLCFSQYLHAICRFVVGQQSRRIASFRLASDTDLSANNDKYAKEAAPDARRCLAAEEGF